MVETYEAIYCTWLGCSKLWWIERFGKHISNVFLKFSKFHKPYADYISLIYKSKVSSLSCLQCSYRHWFKCCYEVLYQILLCSDSLASCNYKLIWLANLIILSVLVITLWIIYDIVSLHIPSHPSPPSQLLLRNNN